ncbi:MAG: hypothetical protein WDN28_26080 [Chthoniobacter sp.]
MPFARASGIVDGDDARMLQLRQRPRFAFKARDELRIGGDFPPAAA